jgi:signal transduction histidine kinase
LDEWDERVHPDDRQSTYAEIDKHFARQTPVYVSEHRVLCKDGSYKWILDRGKVVGWTSEGKPLRVIGTHADINERKRAESALEYQLTLQKLNSEIASALANAGTGELDARIDEALRMIAGFAGANRGSLFVISDDGASVTNTNEGVRPHRIPRNLCCRAFRSRRSGCIEKSCSRVGSSRYRVGTTIPRPRKVSSNGSRTMDSDRCSSYHSVDPADSSGPWASTVKLERGSAGRRTWRQCSRPLATFFRMHSRKRAEEEKERLHDQLVHAQKMEAIGTLAGGVAHDFNNILGGVLSGLSLLELELGDAGDRHRADIQDVKDLVRRGAELANQLLGFSRGGKYDVGPRDVCEVVQKTAAMFGRTRRDISIVQEFASDLDAALVDHAQLEQVLLNLFINAAQAMPGGGRLTVRADNAMLTVVEAECHGAKPGRFVKLVVADTGTGIAPAILPRIFEPFFTTKAPGHGTGLGLASVYGIVKNHGGVITVESEVAKGTTFTILLPAADEPADGRPLPPPDIRLSHGTLLIVDDEESLLRLCARLLRAMGYEVLTASGGRAAIELVRKHHDTLALVILDMTMPEMSGAATFDAIREIAPEIKVLLSSGFSVDGQAQALLDRGCHGFIQKPFDAATLFAKIQSLR